MAFVLYSLMLFGNVSKTQKERLEEFICDGDRAFLRGCHRLETQSCFW